LTRLRRHVQRSAANGRGRRRCARPRRSAVQAPRRSASRRAALLQREWGALGHGGAREGCGPTLQPAGPLHPAAHLVLPCRVDDGRALHSLSEGRVRPESNTCQPASACACVPHSLMRARQRLRVVGRRRVRGFLGLHDGLGFVGVRRRGQRHLPRVRAVASVLPRGPDGAGI